MIYSFLYINSYKKEFFYELGFIIEDPFSYRENPTYHIVQKSRTFYKKTQLAPVKSLASVDVDTLRISNSYWIRIAP